MPLRALFKPAHSRKTGALAAAMLLATLAGCASNSTRDDAWGGDACNARAQGATSVATTALREKQILRTLTEIKADESQRLAVLAAFDQLVPVLRASADGSSERQGQRRLLDPHAANYLASADALAQQQAAALTAREHELAVFNQRVASALSVSQWAEWQSLLLREQAEVEDLQRRGFGGDGRRRPGAD